jgi:proteic killer suppression protein
VIRSFADKQTEQFWVTGTLGRLPPDIERRALRKLSAIDATDQLESLRVPPGNRLHALEGDRAGQRSISVNTNGASAFGSKMATRSMSKSATTTSCEMSER